MLSLPFSFQLAVKVRIHSGHPPPSRKRTDESLPYWMKYPGQLPAIVDGSVLVLNATMSRSACPFTRLLNLYPHGHQQAGRRPTNFRIKEEESEGEAAPAHPLAITRNEGILYVSSHVDHDVFWMLDTFDVRVDWDILPPEEATDDKNYSFIQTALIRIGVIGDVECNVTSDEWHEHHVCDPGLYCAKFRHESDCLLDGVGSVATDGRGCSWRNSPVSNNSINPSTAGNSRGYATCSPDLFTCPDGYCDDLEDQVWEICPQDCTGNSSALLNSAT